MLKLFSHGPEVAQFVICMSLQTPKGKGMIKPVKKRERQLSQSGSKASVVKTSEDNDPEQSTASSTNLGGIVVMCMLMILMLYAVHCTWVTSNAYSSPSVVLASTNYDG